MLLHRKRRECGVSRTETPPNDLHALLAEVAAGRTSVDEAARDLAGLGLTAIGDFACLDTGRAARKGVPEIVFGEGKTVEQFAAIVTAFLTRTPVVLATKASPEQAAAVTAPDGGAAVWHERSRVLVVRRADYRPPETRGVVGVLAGGTGDTAIADEAVVVCREMGVETLVAYDVGVAGVHRLAAPLREMSEAGAKALIVAAGMEGALPSVVCGLVDVPVIGLPVSTGYGIGGRGEAALLGMLQSCSPGLTVVNIDNGIGAGVTAAMIARAGAS
jgi:pyridinium-3,5-biscarboxylic acid mononucleotide synthase